MDEQKNTFNEPQNVSDEQNDIMNKPQNVSDEKIDTSIGTSEKDWLMVLLFCIFLGPFGVHRFYVGKIGTGVLQVLTLGGCGIWALIDLIMVIGGKFTDVNGKYVKAKSNPQS